KRGCRKKQSMWTLRQTSKRCTNPESGEPEAPLLSLLEPGQTAINRPGKERRKKRLGHDNPTENERAAERETDQSGSKSAPVVSQPFADQKREGHCNHCRKSDRDARGCGVHTEKFVAR